MDDLRTKALWGILHISKYTGLKVLSYSSYLVMESGYLPDSIFLEVRGILKPCEPLKGEGVKMDKKRSTWFRDASLSSIGLIPTQISEVLWAIFFKNPQILEKNLRSISQVGSYNPKKKFQELTITIPSKWLDNLPNSTVFVCPPFLLNSTAEGGEIKIL